MSSTVKRLLTFFIGVPLVLAFVYFDIYNHLPLNILIFAFSVFGSIEFYNMVSTKFSLFPKPLIVTFSCVLPIISYVFSLIGLPYDACIMIFVLEIALLMGIEALTSKTFENLIDTPIESLLVDGNDIVYNLSYIQNPVLSPINKNDLRDEYKFLYLLSIRS